MVEEYSVSFPFSWTFEDRNSQTDPCFSVISVSCSFHLVYTPLHLSHCVYTLQTKREVRDSLNGDYLIHHVNYMMAYVDT